MYLEMSSTWYPVGDIWKEIVHLEGCKVQTLAYYFLYYLQAIFHVKLIGRETFSTIFVSKKLFYA